MKKIYICLSFFWWGNLMYAQSNVSVAWSPDTINLGEEASLFLYVQIPIGTEIVSVDKVFLDSIISGFQTARIRQSDSTRVNEFAAADVEVLDYGQFKNSNDDSLFTSNELSWTSNPNGQNIILGNSFKVRAWEVGQIIANSPRVVALNNGIQLSQTSNQAQLFVTPPFSQEELQSDSLDILPIKTIIKEPLKWVDFWILITVLIASIIAGLVFYLVKKYNTHRNKEILEPTKIIPPAHEIALEKLHQLDSSKQWQTDIKSYQSQLTFIIREYLENRFGIPALESTTDEIVASIKGKIAEEELIVEMKHILQVADLVKFAKSRPNVNIHQEFMDKAFEFVRVTKIENPIIEQ